MLALPFRERINTLRAAEFWGARASSRLWPAYFGHLFSPREVPSFAQNDSNHIRDRFWMRCIRVN